MNKLVYYHQDHYMHQACYEDAEKYEPANAKWDLIGLIDEDKDYPCSHFDCKKKIGEKVED